MDNTERLNEIMIRLVKAGISFDDVSAAWDDAYDRYEQEQEKKKNDIRIAGARTEVLDALSAYVELVYGVAMDAETKKALEKDFINIERAAAGTLKAAKKVADESDDERIRAWIEKMFS